MVFTQAHASNPSSARPRVPLSPLGWVPPAALHRQPFGRAPPNGGPVQARTGKRTSLSLTLLAPPTSAPELQALALAAKLASKSQTSLQLQKEVHDAPQRGIATVPQCALGWTAQLQAMPFGFARIDPSLGGAAAAAAQAVAEADSPLWAQQFSQCCDRLEGPTALYALFVQHLSYALFARRCGHRLRHAPLHMFRETGLTAWLTAALSKRSTTSRRA